MACTPFSYKGAVGIVCGPRRPLKMCACGAVSIKLCDGPGAKPGKTCDKPMCGPCAVPVGPDRDLCIDHDWERYAR